MKVFFTCLLFLYTTLLSGQAEQKIRLWATYYYVPSLAYSENGIELLDKNEEKTGIKLDSCDWCKAAIEGTIFVRKNAQTYVLNYAGRSKELQFDCRQCSTYRNYDGFLKTGKVLWMLSTGLGKGIREYNLVPFVTLAVDSSVIPYGSVVYIPKAKGVQYLNPSGKIEVHDGYFFAGDTGSKITGNHIDVFLGASSQNPFDFIRSDKNEPFDAYIISDKELIRRLTGYHKQ